jgi:signal transduction histidine kinase
VEPSQQAGADLAKSADVRSLEAAERGQWYRARALSAHLVAACGRQAWLASVAVFVVAALAVAEYPTFRVLALAATFAVTLGFYQRQLHMDAQSIASAPRRQWTTDIRCMTPRIVLLLLADAFTGGIRSPMVPAVLIPFSGLVVASGWSRASKTVLAGIAAGLLAMAILPQHWFGPAVPHPAYWMILLLGLATGGAWHTKYVLTLTRQIGESAAQLARAREEMVERALARARDMEQLSATLSHELKNPLAAIKTLVELAAQDPAEASSREGLHVARTEIDRMRGILQEYLSFSRPFEQVSREPVDLGALSDEVLVLLGPSAQRNGVALRRRGDARLEADPRRLKEALINLVANAVQATPRGGFVEIAIDRRDTRVEVAVHDSGQGMPAEVLEKVGTPFFTTRKEGTGLGVSLARAAFVQHGGALEYSTAEGRGTTATGILPISRRSDGASTLRG